MVTAPKKTGLAESLLFRRSAKPAPQEPLPRAPEPLPPGVETDRPAPIERPTRRVEREMRLRDRCTLYLDEEINELLDTVARFEQKQRSEVVTELLRKYLPRYRVIKQ